MLVLRGSATTSAPRCARESCSSHQVINRMALLKALAPVVCAHHVVVVDLVEGELDRRQR